MSIQALVGANVKLLRLQREWSQEELADRCGVHRTYISGLERGVRNPTIAILEKIAASLSVSAYELLRPVG